MRRSIRCSTRQCWCFVQIVSGDLLNTKNWAVRAASHITWTALIELPSYIISTDGMLAWDEATVAAAMAPSHAKLGFNSTTAADVDLDIHTACIENQRCAAPEAFLSSSHTS